MSSSSGRINFLYQYVPSLPAAIVSIVVFAALTIGHCYYLIRRRTWFCIAFAVGGLFETVGYVGRAIGNSNNRARNPYIVQSILILVAPALFAATIYMSLGRLIRATEGEKYSIVRVTWMTKIFVIGDILSFFVQGAAGGIMAGGDMDKVNLGQKIILGGLFLQIIMFGLFILASILFHYRLRKSPTQQSYNPDLEWQKTLFILYAVSALIMIRNIFRVAEYIEGFDGPLLTVEWPIYVFDALLMAATMLVFYWGYPSKLRPKDLESEAITELTQTQRADVAAGRGDGKG